ncbi:Importin subunit alpha-1 [Tulasnella sp. 424]|nr:Importin subunit alpha-1 [Tulasnella sp. 424]KAG8970169.1 Importin subunit alpha-1 [Tulasnella sp. 425]
MSSTTEDIAIEAVENRPVQDESDEEDEEVDESVLDGYLTEDKHITPEIVNAFRSNDRDARLEAAKKLQQLGDKRDTLAAQEIVHAGLLPTILEMMSSDDIQSQVKATELTAIVTGSASEPTSAAVEAGVIPRVITLATSETTKGVRNASLIVIGNIAADSQPLREKLIREGGLKPPLDVLANPSKYPGGAVYFAANAINGYTHPPVGKLPGYEVTKQMIPVLSGYILYQKEEDADSLQLSLLSLSRILEDEPQVDDFLRTDVLPRLVHLCSSKETETRNNALLCVNQIILFSVDGTEKLINAGILPIFKTCIEGSEQDRRSACFGASNLVVGTLDHARAFMGLDFVPILVKILSNEEEVRGIRNDAAWTLSSLATNWGQDHHDILDTLLEASVPEAFCLGLNLENRDAVEVSLKGIQVFLRPQWEGQKRAIGRILAGDGIDQLRALRVRRDLRSTELPKLAQKLLDSHFPDFSRAARV